MKKLNKNKVRPSTSRPKPKLQPPTIRNSKESLGKITQASSKRLFTKWLQSGKKSKKQYSVLSSNQKFKCYDNLNQYIHQNAVEAYKPVLSVVKDGVAKKDEVVKLSFDKMFP